jgi:hypothetical protein
VLQVGHLVGPDLLLGRNWLYNNGVELNFAERTMKVHFPNARGDDSKRILPVVEKVVVQSGTTRRFPATIADKWLWGWDCQVEGINLASSVSITTCLEHMSLQGSVYLTLENASYCDDDIEGKEIDLWRPHQSPQTVNH